jgi:hypothetical protein
MLHIAHDDVRVCLTRPAAAPGPDHLGAGVLATPTRVLVPDLHETLQQPGMLFDIVLIAPDGVNLRVERHRPASLDVLRQRGRATGAITLAESSALPAAWPLHGWTPDKLGAALAEYGGDVRALLLATGKVHEAALDLDDDLLAAAALTERAAAADAFADATLVIDAPHDADASDLGSRAEWRTFACRFIGCPPGDLTFEEPHHVVIPESATRSHRA